MSEQRKPWNMREDETPRAYRAFEVYRDMAGDRSLERLCQVHTAALPTAKAWSVRYEWQARVRAFDEAVAARAADRALEDAVAVRARQAADAKRLQELGIERLSTLPVGQLKPGHAIQAWKIGAEAERKALGIADKVELAGETGVRITFAYEDAKPGDDEGGNDG
jgi:hypothetical protein